MRIVEIKVYPFSELSDAAKEKARKWWLLDGLNYDWWEYTKEESENLGLRVKSFDLDYRRIETEVLTSAPEIAEATIKEHGETCDTYKTASAYLLELARVGAACDAPDGSEAREKWEGEREKIDDIFKRDLSYNILDLLKNEWEYLNSDEYVNETLSQDNGLEFTESGKVYHDK